MHPYDDIAEVLEYVNHRPSPLAAYWIGEDSPDFDRFRSHTTSGGVTRNSVSPLHYAPTKDLPFGGVGRSGMGAYHGKTGFDTFSHKRVITSSPMSPTATSRVIDSTPVAVAAMREEIASTFAEVERRLAGAGG